MYYERNSNFYAKNNVNILFNAYKKLYNGTLNVSHSGFSLGEAEYVYSGFSEVDTITIEQDDVIVFPSLGGRVFEYRPRQISVMLNLSAFAGEEHEYILTNNNIDAAIFKRGYEWHWKCYEGVDAGLVTDGDDTNVIRDAKIIKYSFDNKSVRHGYTSRKVYTEFTETVTVTMPYAIEDYQLYSLLSSSDIALHSTASIYAVYDTKPNYNFFHRGQVDALNPLVRPARISESSISVDKRLNRTTIEFTLL
jgi:hypothetical protein